MTQTSLPDLILPHYGTAAVGASRFPRPEIETRALDAMTRTNGLRLFGLRRIGKSTLLQYCVDQLRERGIHVIDIDAEGMSLETDLLYGILAQLPSEDLRSRIFRAVSNSNVLPQTIRTAFEKKTGITGDTIEYFRALSSVIGTELQRPGVDQIAIVIDEFSFLCRTILQGDQSGRGARRVEVLLAALRGWRSNGVRMVLSGSIGLAALARRYKVDLTHNSDLNPLDLPPFLPEQHDTVVAFVSALVKGGEIEGWTDLHTESLLDECTAWYPSLIQQALLELSPGGQAVRIDEIPDLFATNIRLALDENFFQQFDKRLKSYDELDGVIRPAFKPLCGAAVVAKVPLSRQDLAEAAKVELDEVTLAEALRILREDGFLTVRIDREGLQQWSVASPLVTAWWRQR